MKYAEVAVEGAGFSFDMAFDYIIPAELEERAKPGCRVTVPFGRSNKKTIGIIFEVKDVSSGKNLKKITEVEDDYPVLSAEMLSLAAFIKDRCFCSLYEAAKAMLPAGLNRRMVVSYAVNPDAPAEKAQSLEGAEKEFYDFLVSRGVFVRSDLIFKNLGMRTDKAVPASLLKKELILSKSDSVRNLGELTARMIRLLPGWEDLNLTAKQREMACALNDVSTAAVSELCYFTGCTPAVAKALVKNGAAEFYECPVYHYSAMAAGEGERTPIKLTDEQNTAYKDLREKAFSGKAGVSLLYGVTGSGKTSVYMKLMDDVLDSGRSVLLLVPEIGLTPQALSIFCRRYGEKVAVFHSALSVRDRSEQWKRVRNKEATVVIGTRSAVFAPFDNLGLIIIDEEQEHTYKSEQTPRYDAADVAKFRGAYNSCLLLLASATPKVESYASALSGKYGLCTLRGRYGGAAMPEVRTVDMRKAEKMPGSSEISKELYEAIKETLDSGKQAILLINRRGYNTFAVCDSCSEVITCPNCSISLTYHSANNRLMCHYCGYSREFTRECPNCGREGVRYAGFGTQKITDELASLFPGARIVRMDADTTGAKDSHDKILGAFEKGEYDILLGTQMVAKGLDFPNVTLVGVISIDQQLYNDDFRSLEKAFSLLTQVVGRSGRGDSKGIAVVQTLTPENGIIKTAARQEYDSSFKNEIRIRKGMIYPPFCDLCVLGVTGEEEQKVRSACNALLGMLRDKTQDKYKKEKIIVLRPVPARVMKMAGRYRYRIIIKCRNSSGFRQMISEILKDVSSEKTFKNVTVYADINPDTML